MTTRNREPSAVRLARASAKPCQATIAPTTAAAATTAVAAPAHIAAISATRVTLNAIERRVASLPARTSVGGSLRTPLAKYQDHCSTEFVSTPRVTRWIVVHQARGT